MVLTEVWQTWMRCVPGGDGPCAPGAADWLVLLAVAAGLVVAVRAGRRTVDVLLTLRATAWSTRVARHLSRLVKARDYTAAAFFDADGAGEPWAARRREGLDRLARHLNAQYPQTIAWSNAIRRSFSDLRFTDATRVPLAFAGLMREQFNLASVVTASDGPRLRDLDGTGPSMSVAPTGSTSRASRVTSSGCRRAWTGSAMWGRCWAPSIRLLRRT